MTAPVRVFQILECASAYGPGQVMAALTESLDPARFEQWVIYNVRKGFSASEFEALTPKAARRIRVPEMVRSVRPLGDLKAFLALRRLMVEHRPAVVHAHSSKAGVLARLAARSAGVPKIYYSPHGYGFLQTDSAPAVRLMYWLFELAVSWIGEIVSTSPGEAARARRLAWGKAVHVVPNLFAMPAAPEPAGPGGPLVIGAMGRLTAARNPEAFLRLAGRLGSGGGARSFLWLGGGEREGEIRERAAGLEGVSVELPGYLPRAELLARLAGVGVFVHFSSWEGSPVSVMEAMHFGIPVVASDIAGNRELVADGETGRLVRDEDELLSAVRALAQDADLRAEMGRKARARLAAEFPLEKSVRALENLYTL